jgi:NPCBM/NEW2 domain
LEGFVAKTKFPELTEPEGSGTAPLAAGLGTLADVAGVVLLFESWKGALLFGAISVVLATLNLWLQHGRVIGRAVFSVFLVGLVGAGLVGASVHHYLVNGDDLPFTSIGRKAPHHEPAPVSSESTDPAGHEPTLDPDTVQLGQLQPFDGGGSFVSGPQEVNATHYDQTLHTDDFRCDLASQTYQLKKKYTTFQVDVGLSDDTVENDPKAKFIVTVDGQEKGGLTVGLGKVIPLKVSVKGAYRLEIAVDSDEYGCGGNDVVAVWINPRLSR